jgi:hypothetical protein
MNPDANSQRTMQVVLVCIYFSLFLSASSVSVWLSSSAQPGGINPVNAAVSPILGPWSVFLNPNALPFAKAAPGYLLFAIGLTFCILFFLPMSCILRNRLLAILFCYLGSLSTLVWLFMGVKRVVLDLM